MIDPAQRVYDALDAEKAENARLREALAPRIKASVARELKEFFEMMAENPVNEDEEGDLHDAAILALLDWHEAARAALQEGNNNGSANPPTEGEA